MGRAACWGLVLACLSACLGRAAPAPAPPADSGGSSGTTSQSGAAGLVGVAPQDIVNPGGCGTLPDPGREGFQPPGAARWVPDCAAERLREYWRVMTEDGIHAYTIPRLDGQPLLEPVCKDRRYAVYPLVQRYGLCSVVETEAQLELVNSMALADALELTHYLHHVLRFELAESGFIQPYPFKQDLLDACQLGDNSAELTVICEKEQQQAQQAFGFVGPGADQLVERLNQLYGVTDT